VVVVAPPPPPPHPASTTMPMTMRGGSGRQPRRKPRTALRYWPGFKDG